MTTEVTELDANSEESPVLKNRQIFECYFLATETKTLFECKTCHTFIKLQEGKGHGNAASHVKNKHSAEYEKNVREYLKNRSLGLIAEPPPSTSIAGRASLGGTSIDVDVSHNDSTLDHTENTSDVDISVHSVPKDKKSKLSKIPPSRSDVTQSTSNTTSSTSSSTKEIIDLEDMPKWMKYWMDRDLKEKAEYREEMKRRDEEARIRQEAHEKLLMTVISAIRPEITQPIDQEFVEFQAWKKFKALSNSSITK